MSRRCAARSKPRVLLAVLLHVATPLLAGCATSPGLGPELRGLLGGVLAAQHPPLAGFQREDEWVTVGDFRHVTSLATGDDAVYVGTAGGVEVLPFLTREPSSTITAGDGLPTSVVTALAFDPRQGRLWIGTPLGLARYDPFRGEVEVDPAGLGRVEIGGVRVGPGGGFGSDTESLAEAVFVEAGGEWLRIDPFTLSAQPAGRAAIPPGATGPDPRALPFLAGGTVRGERSGRPESFRITATAEAPGGRVALGTWGANAWMYDGARLAADPVVYGLAGPGGGALGFDGERLWFTNAVRRWPGSLSIEAVRDETGVAWATGDLREWRHAYPGLEPNLPSDHVHDVAFAGGRTFLATDAGLAVRDAERDAWLRVPATAELAGEVLAVEPAADGVWVGTRAGLVALRWPAAGDSAAAPHVVGRWLDGREVRTLAADASAVYAGTALGLVRLAPDTTGAWGLHEVPTAPAAIVDLAVLEGSVVVASDRGVEVLQRDGAPAEQFFVGEGFLDDPPLAVAADRDNLWIGTRAGVSRWDRVRRRWTEYGLVDGLPDRPVLDVLVQDASTVWFSTPGGVVRFRPRDVEDR